MLQEGYLQDTLTKYGRMWVRGFPLKQSSIHKSFGNYINCIGNPGYATLREI